MKSKAFSPFKLVLVTTALCVLLESGGNAAELWQPTTKDVTLSEYSPKDLSLVAQVHAGRIFTDYERHGFFRIGLLPIPVAEDVQIQIASAECLTNALFALHDWEQPAIGIRRAELRNLQIAMFGENQPRLRAATAHVRKDDLIELLNVTVTSITGQKISIARGILQIAGIDAGRLFWNADGHAQELYPLKLKTKTL